MTRDVAPSLLWGIDHVELLKERLDAARANRELDEATPLALQNLPEKVDLASRLYVVMGGLSGAAASDKGIYVDLLSNAWRSKERSHPMTPHEMVEFFAHESHHVGYGRLLDEKKEQLDLKDGEGQAWGFISALMMEGSATLLINAHGSWTQLEQQNHIKPDITRLPQLLPATQRLLQRTLNERLEDQEYQEAVSGFPGEGYHATGARLLYVIERARGKQEVLKVMENPRSLLAIYNECAAEEKESFRFDPKVAKTLQVMGVKK